MLVPVFADFGKGFVRIAQVGVVGDSTRSVIFNMEQEPKKLELNALKTHFSAD